ncbi:hypothetical protein LJB42_002750 [Komagataella kurtzmanii]|nr:hypothetical protein LJB42_002750 [Komagataella kurtzmanii]
MVISSRRSIRLRSSQKQSQDLTQDLTDIDDLSSSDAQADSDEEYSVTKKRKKQTIKTVSKKTKGNPKRKNTRVIPSSVDQLEDFQENSIFKALSDDDVAVSELSAFWLEQFEESPTDAIKDLLNFTLRCCGCVSQIQEHDVANPDSATETVGEIQQFFQSQKAHEFPLMASGLAKISKWKYFRNRVVEFVEQILFVAHENRMLYENENLMESILVWLSALSTSNLRPLRYASTLFLLTMETTLCRITVKVASLLSKTQNQYDSEKRKLTSRTKSSRLNSIQANIDTHKLNKKALDDYLTDITHTTFIHRYRDVDPKIRKECMSALGLWIDIYPEFFFENTYLRYFGWILSDADAHVRFEVLKSLGRLYKKDVIATGFRQFTERFKKRIIEIAIFDLDFHAKSQAISVLCEITMCGYLENVEELRVIGSIFLSCSHFSKSQTHRIHAELSKYIAIVEAGLTKHFLESHTLPDEQCDELSNYIKYGNFARLLQDSYELYSTEEQTDLLGQQKLHLLPFYDVNDFYSSVYHIPRYYNHGNSVPQVLKFLVTDFTSMESLSDTLRKALQLDSDGVSILLNYVRDSLSCYNEKGDYDNSRKKSGSEDPSKDVIVSAIIDKIPVLFEKFKSSKHKFQCLLQMFNHIFEGSFFHKLNSQSTCEELTDSILTFFQGMNVYLSKDSPLNADFSTFFKLIIKSAVQSNDTRLRLSIDALCKQLSKTGNLNFISLRKLLLVGEFTNTSDYLEPIIERLVEVQCIEERLDVWLQFTSRSLKTALEFITEEKSLTEELLQNLFGKFPFILRSLKENLDHIRTATTFANILAACKSFALRVEGREHDSIVGPLASFFLQLDLSISPEVERQLLHNFLVLESKLATVLNIQLEREEDDEVSFQETNFEETTVWDAEQDICGYVLILKRLFDIGVMSTKSLERIRLNETLLGNVFASVVKEIKLKASELEPVPEITSNDNNV